MREPEERKRSEKATTELERGGDLSVSGAQRTGTRISPLVRVGVCVGGRRLPAAAAVETRTDSDEVRRMLRMPASRRPKGGSMDASGAGRACARARLPALRPRTLIAPIY